MSVDRFPSLEFLNELYRPENYRSSLVSDRQLVQRCAKRVIRSLDQIPNPFRILDFGGADGSLALELKSWILALHPEHDVSISVVDIYDRVTSSDAKFVHVDQFLKSADQYELVLASAVIEHLRSPGEFLRRLFSAISSRGAFYARTPYESPLARLVPGYRLKWPRHLHDFGPEFWSEVPARLGYSGQTVYSRPSLVETTFRDRPVQTMLAHLLKIPGRIESACLSSESGWRLWRFVGGWEVLLKR